MKVTSKKGVVKMAEFVVDKDGIKRFLVSITVNGNKYTKMVKANSLLVNFLGMILILSAQKERANRVTVAPAPCCWMGSRSIHAWFSLLVWTDGSNNR